MNPTRRAALIHAKLRSEGAIATDENGVEFLVSDEKGIKPTQTVVIVRLRSMLSPSADPAEYRRALNRRKRERKARS